MSILFLLKTLETGGLEVVTSVLANKFVAEGHHVCIFSFLGGRNSIAERLDKQVLLTMGNGYAASWENVKKMREVLIKNGVNVIINQWGLPLVPIKTACRATQGLNIKIISVYHNAPSFNGRIQKLNIQLMECENPVRRVMLRMLSCVYKAVISRAMKYIYNQSDLFLVLSACYKNEFCEFTGIKDTRKLEVMTNPVTIDARNFHYDSATKQREIIYVGRLDFVQKRVYRVIDTWNFLEESFPNWQLTIVGDGEDRSNLENHVRALGLKHVSFEGFKTPLEYYKRASILMLTSDFEGFPLVLAECMSFGVVPVVYNSYAAVSDIIEDDKDGMIISYNEKFFDAESMGNRIALLIRDVEKRAYMAMAAIEKSKLYSIDEIYQKWMRIMQSI